MISIIVYLRIKALTNEEGHENTELFLTPDTIQIMHMFVDFVYDRCIYKLRKCYSKLVALKDGSSFLLNINEDSALITVRYAFATIHEIWNENGIKYIANLLEITE